MVANRPRGDDDLTELPWASVFDPAANARALSAIQAEGFRAASRVVDRFAQIAGDVSGARQVTDPGTAKAAAPLTPGLNPDVDLIITTWWTVVGQMFRAMRGETVSGDETSVGVGVGVNVDVATDVATGAVQLASGETAEIWLHNSGGDDSTDTVLRCSDLLAHDGAVIASTAVGFRRPTWCHCPHGRAEESRSGSRRPTMSNRAAIAAPSCCPIIPTSGCRSSSSCPRRRHDEHGGSRRPDRRGRGPAARGRQGGSPGDARRDARRRTGRNGCTGRCANTRRGRGRLCGPRCVWPRAGHSAPSAEDLLGIAVAIELLHNAFLVHDDVADGSEMRRGRPTLAATHGDGGRAQCRRRPGDRGRPGVAAGHPQDGPRPGRPGDGRVRHHGDAHAGGPGHRSRLAARRRRGPWPRGLPRT